MGGQGFAGSRAGLVFTGTTTERQSLLDFADVTESGIKAWAITNNGVAVENGKNRTLSRC